VARVVAFAARLFRDFCRLESRMKITTTHLLAVDPGGMTGLALFSDWSENSAGKVWLAEANFYEACKAIKGMLDAGDITVCAERFNISERTIKLGRDHTAIEILGVVKWLLLEHELPEMLLASPADAKRLVTDARLKTLGIHYKGGAGHAHDAARHGILWLVKAGDLRLPA